MAVSDVQEPEVVPDDQAGQRFAQARKGYSPEAVDAFLDRVGERVHRLEGELERQRARAELLERKIASAQEAAYARVFRHLMEVMRSAEDAASRIRRAAEDEGRSLVELAQREARRVRESARAEADRILVHARDQAARAKATMLVRDATVAVDRPAVGFDAPRLPRTEAFTPPWAQRATVRALPTAPGDDEPNERAAGEPADLPSFDDIGRSLQAHVVELFSEPDAGS
jgi:DivIVA domain-containing protein